MAITVVEVDELKPMISEIVQSIVSQKQDERLFITPKEFAEEIGITYQYFKDHILYEEKFQKAVIQKDRKIYIKRELGRQLAVDILDEYRR
ncbi:hypothetical protein [Jeotgalicoccus marinus]|uniref:hypothetical protein n=1 Tax=Jeotgalicoccus marinus TaxID=516700 RepID=UPI00041AB4B6|nr:hypothetical protein [Jeotgalicoccus marinus]